MTLAGQVLLTADARARSIAVRPELSSRDATAAARALIDYLAARRNRDIIVETIDGRKAATSPWSPAFVDAGLRLTTRGLRYYATR